MTKSELIKKLESYSDDTEIVIATSRDYRFRENFKLIDMKLKPHSDKSSVPGRSLIGESMNVEYTKNGILLY